MSDADQSLATAVPSWRTLAIAGTVTVVLCLVLIVWVDVPLAVYVHAYDATTFAKLFAVITPLGNATIWVVVAVLAMAVAAMEARRAPSQHASLLLRQRLRAWSFLIVTLAASGLLINSIKLVVGRARPPALFETGAAHFYPLSQIATSWSFPSGHSQTIWAAMTALGWIYPPLRVPCLVLAVLVSASRVIIGVHFLSDIIAGAFLAVVVAVFVRRAFERGGISVTLQERS